MSSVCNSSNVEPILSDVESLEGNIDRKDVYVNPTQETFKLLLDDIQESLMVSRGDCIVCLGSVDGDCKNMGISEDEMKKSVETLELICKKLSCVKTILLDKKLGNDRNISTNLLRRGDVHSLFQDVRVAIMGNVDAGKTSLLGVLTLNQYDDGRGLVRGKLHKHQHEIESGRTSSVSNYIMGFDQHCKYLPPVKAKVDWNYLCTNASKIISFIDLAGHEKYFKTTVFGMTSNRPHYAILMIGANAGVIGMTKEHLNVILALRVPLIIVITKIDMCPENILKETLSTLQKLMKSSGIRKMPVLVNNMEDALIACRAITQGRICPLFQVSNVTGQNIDLLKKFLNLLPTRETASADQDAEFIIDRTFKVTGVGTVVAGLVTKGTITVNDNVWMGPDYAGKFNMVQVKTLHLKRVGVNELKCGYGGGIALKKVNREDIRRGMVICSNKANLNCCYDFLATLIVLHHPTTISVGYQGVCNIYFVNVDNIRQPVQLVEMNQPFLRTGDKAKVKFRFIMYPEFLKPQSRLIFREGRTKAFGTVLEIIPYITGHPVPKCLSKTQLQKMKTAQTLQLDC